MPNWLIVLYAAFFLVLTWLVASSFYRYQLARHRLVIVNLLRAMPAAITCCDAATEVRCDKCQAVAAAHHILLEN